MHGISAFVHGAQRVRLLGSVALLLALAGCFVSQSRKDEADAKARTAYEQCEQRRRIGQYNSHLAAVNCAVPTVVAAYQESAYPFTDLVYISIQARRIGAAKVDAREVTETQYRNDLATLDARLAAEEARRREIMKFGGNPEPVAVNTLTQGLSAFATAPAPTPPAMSSGTNPGCLPLGGIKSCK